MSRNQPEPNKRKYPAVISRYLKEKRFSEERLWNYSPKNGITTLVDGKLFTWDEFQKEYPVNAPSNFYLNKDNPNVKNNFS